MTNKNILEVCLSPDLGGLELYMNKCSKYLKKDFTIYNIITRNSKLESYFKDDGFLFKFKKRSSFSLINAFKLAKIIDRNQIDIIHLHWTKDIPIVVFGKLLSKRKPKIVQTRHMNITRFKDDFYHKFLYKNIDMIVAVTKELEKQLIKFIPDEIRPNIKQIYLGVKCPKKYLDSEIDILKKSLNSEKSFMIGFVGRINKQKGQYLLIESMNLLKEKKLNVKAFFVGHAMDEEYLSELKEKIKNYSLEESISFLGFFKEPYKFMQACDTLIVASKNETFGLVAVESMYMGTPVVGTNSGGLLEIIDDENNGLLFEKEDYVSLSSKIELIYKNKSLKDKLSFSSEQKVSKVFNNQKQFNTLIKSFESLF